MLGSWDDAISYNKKVLQQFPKNIAALNRLARAYCEKGDLKRARKAYKKVLSIDQYNPIATRNLKRISDNNLGETREVAENSPCSNIFLEEPGKTKIVSVVRLTSAEKLATIDCGDQVFLTTRNHYVVVAGKNDLHLGSLPEDISQKLIMRIQGGNRYLAFVKAVEKNKLEIMVREVYRSPRFQKCPSL